MIDIFKSFIMEGHFRMTGYSPSTKESRILVDQRNTILSPATEIVARSLGGLANSSVTHLYLGYNNADTFPSDVLTADSLTFYKDSNYNFLRLPLTFTPSISDIADGTMVTFNIIVNQPESFAIPTYAALTSGTSDFFEAALISQTSPTGSISSLSGDLPFSRVRFQPLAYDSLFNLTISWGIKLSI